MSRRSGVSVDLVSHQDPVPDQQRRALVRAGEGVGVDAVEREVGRGVESGGGRVPIRVAAAFEKLAFGGDGARRFSEYQASVSERVSMIRAERPFMP